MLATRVAVPEAPVNENYCPSAGKHNVWLAREIASMQAKAETLRMKPTADQPFGTRISVPDLPHDPASLLLAEDIGHSWENLRGSPVTAGKYLKLTGYYPGHAR